MWLIFFTLSYVGIWDSGSGGDHGELHWYGRTMQRVRTHLYSTPDHFRLLLFTFWWIYCIPEYCFLYNFIERTLEKNIRIHPSFQFCFFVVLMFLLFSLLLLPSSLLPSSLSYLFALRIFFSLTSFNIYFILFLLIL